MKTTILLMLLSALAPVAVEKVEDMRELLLAKAESLRGKSLTRWRVFGIPIRVRIKGSDIDKGKEKIREVDALTVTAYLARLADAL